MASLAIRTIVIGFALGSALSTIGCTSAVGVWPATQSHYTKAAARILPIGEAEGTASDWCITFGGLVDAFPDVPREAVRKAILVQNGDLLTDYVLSLYIVRGGIPGVDFLTFWWIRWKAEGTVAKVEYPVPDRPGPGQSAPLKSEPEPQR